ncbi:MAG: 4Fe-4S dicluster domain-containing protein [Elusimicrobia bacterium]|nr:4Fe-4S dicluster domain-containing protein [Elusimicrobiota bacterium]
MKKTKRKIIRIDEEKCNGCKECIPGCPEQAIQIVDTPKGPKARLVKEFYCDGLGACLGSCPTGALTIEEREADVYDEEATIARIKEVSPDMLETHLKHLKEHAKELPEHHSHHALGMSGCPGAKVMSWGEKKEKTEKKQPQQKQGSELRQWPVQLTLVNPSAPYFEGADLVIAADCVPFAYANFHQDFLVGKTLAIGCPKLDDIDFYRQKLVEIFKTAGIKSVTVANMEVPCCFGLQHLVKEAIKESGKKIPYCEIVVSIKGEIQ